MITNNTSVIYPYAGFWKRFLASIVDGLVLLIPTIVLLVLLVVLFIGTGGLSLNDQVPTLAQRMQQQRLATVCQFGMLVINIVYFAWMESSKYQATLGKMLVGIKVVTLHGERLSFWHAVGRFATKWVSGLTFNVGYIMAGTTRRKQALHDILAKTYVVDKSYNPGEELPEVTPHLGLLILVTVLQFVAIALVFLIPILLLAFAAN